MSRISSSGKSAAIAAALVLSAALFLAPGAAFAADPVVKPYATYELGTVKILAHTYRSGAESNGNSNFDFVNQGGQEILYPFERYVAGLNIAGRHDVQFLYQPLEVNTKVTFRAPVKVDNIIFTAGTPMNLTYSFPFYRLTYKYRVAGNNDTFFSAGAAVQLRNASIKFEQVDGAPGQLVVGQNLGIVPALAVAGRVKLGAGAWLAMEATGIYASSSIINGANFAFEGSLLDASIRAGMAIADRADAFINVRFLGGTASGVSQYPVNYWTEALDKDTDNRLATLSLTLGATVRMAP